MPWCVSNGSIIRMMIASVVCAIVLATGAAPLSAHGTRSEQYRIVVQSVEPAGLPVDVRVSGDKLRFENAGSDQLILCGYKAAEQCEPFVRIDSKGVFENRQAEAYFANLDENQPGEVPDELAPEPEWKRIRSEPLFYAYHDHRAHWMGGDRLPPGVDASNTDPQMVNRFEVEFTYGDTAGIARGRLENVGGQTWLQRYGENALTLGAIAIMLIVFFIDARRRKRASQASGDTAAKPTVT